MKRLSAICLMALMVLALVAPAGAGKYLNMIGDWEGEWQAYGPENSQIGNDGGQLLMVVYGISPGNPLFKGMINIAANNKALESVYFTASFSSKKEFKGVCTSSIDGQVSAFITGTVAGSTGPSASPTITGVWQGMDGRSGWFSLRRKDF